MTEATKKVASGDFNVKLESQREDEIGELTQNFNQMVNELGKVEVIQKDFINNVSHEIKTPISSIQGFAKLLEDENLPEAERKEYAEIIVRHYRQQEQYKDIAEDLEISYQQVTQRKTEAFRKMRRDSQTLKQLKPYIEDMRSTALQGNGVGTFNRTWTSSTERAVLLQEKYNNVMAEINQLKQRTKTVP